MKTVVYACAVTVIFFGIYLSGMAPNITSDDSGELSTVCATLGTAHPSGYPVYTLIGKNLVSFVPFGNFAYRANLISVISGVLTITLVFLILSALSNDFLFGWALIAAILGFAQHFWFMALVTKYYTLNSFFIMFLFYILTLNYKNPQNKYIILFFFALGLGFGNHYTLVLYFPAMFLFIFLSKNKNLFNFKNLVLFLSFFLLGLSVYAYIYVRAQQNPILGWEDPKTFERFWGIIARSRYGAFSIARGYSSHFNFEIIRDQFYFFVDTMLKSFGLFNVILFVFSMIAFFIKDKKLSLVFLTMFFIAGPGFLVSTRTKLDDSIKDLLERYIYLGFISVPLIIGAAVSSFKPLLTQKTQKFFLSVVLLVSISALFARNYPKTTHRQDLSYPDQARNILRTLPRNSILLSDRADEMEFTLAYLTKAIKLRPDITFIDCNASVSRSIYGDNYYKIWGNPRLQIREAYEKQIISNSNRPVYYATFEPNMINIPRYFEGIIFNTKKPMALQSFPWDEIYVFRQDSNMDFRTHSLLASNYQLLGKYFLETGDSSGAEKAFAGFEAYESGGSVSVEAYVAYMYFEKNMIDKALKEYLKIVNQGKASAEVYTNLGVAYEKMGKTDKAIENYNKAIEIKPEYIQAHQNLAVAYWQKNDWKKVAEQYEIVIKYDPSNLSAQRYLAAARQKIK
ncbi:MAG: hypothetical protein A3J83_05220 [Elusimicrobia bacterium RIFOXYA2_FULL_40_6]|nr:MAG: hypothetical protein A3J83_05220 [Elusimicrobia bacterium RIFOXYA2_FULL_40_6]